MKHCQNKNCKNLNPQLPGDFTKDRHQPDGLDRYCRGCKRQWAWKHYFKNAEKISKRTRSYLKAHPEKSRAYHAKSRKNNPDSVLNSKLKYDYGITLKQFNEMRKAQNDSCGICYTPSNRLCVDHDHKTGKVRGLLCRKCNLALGFVDDSTLVLEAMIAYLGGPDAAYR